MPPPWGTTGRRQGRTNESDAYNREVRGWGGGSGVCVNWGTGVRLASERNTRPADRSTGRGRPLVHRPIAHVCSAVAGELAIFPLELVIVRDLLNNGKESTSEKIGRHRRTNKKRSERCQPGRFNVQGGWGSESGSFPHWRDDPSTKYAGKTRGHLQKRRSLRGRPYSVPGLSYAPSSAEKNHTI